MNSYKLGPGDWKYIAAILLFLIAAKVTHAHLVYGDWTCAVAECRKVKQ